MESLDLDLEIINFIEKSEMTSTWAIGRRFSIETSKMLKRMKQLESAGFVEKHHFSSSNNTVWKLTDKVIQALVNIKPSEVAGKYSEVAVQQADSIRQGEVK